MEKVNMYGRMEVNMLEISQMIKRREMANQFLPIKIGIQVSFQMIKEMGKANIFFIVGDIMKEIGKMMSKKVKEFMFIEMDKNIQEILKMI